MPRVVMNHTGFVVEDLERSRKFYMEGLGLEELKLFEIQSYELGRVVGYDNAHIKASMLAGADGHVLELIEYIDPPTEVSDIGTQATLWRTCATHLAFYVEDAKATWQRLVDMGGKAVNPPIELLPGVWLCYMQDPDGNWIEITSDVEHDRLQFIIRHNMITQ